ncbi:MAG: GNAT family N-acetyltransferase [Clostridia bacterium]|nr:GNAT family N-acetyltransferase [Clostridia bacterium]
MNRTQTQQRCGPDEIPEAGMKLHIPALDELWFKEELLADPETMSYNHTYGGTIPFPREKWAAWYNRWIVHHENKRFYRYLKLDDGTFVGEIAYHLDEERGITIADVIVHAKYRGRGYGRTGLNLLCQTAKENGVTVLYDDIAIDNLAVTLFLQCGFAEEYRTDEIIMLKKQL